MKSVLQILEEGRARVARGWTRGAFARGYDGEACSAQDPAAVQWCTIGALYVEAAGIAAHHAAVEVLRNDPETKIYNTAGINVWNDQPWRTQEEVVALFDRAIARVEAGAP